MSTAGFIFAILATLLIAVGDIAIEYWSLGQATRNMFLTGGLFLYAIGTLFWVFTLKSEYISKSISILTVLNLVICVLAGVFLFEEQLSLINKIGIALSVTSVILISL
jgi:drug/metabolite transporter (DMT)-like permease